MDLNLQFFLLFTIWREVNFIFIETEIFVWYKENCSFFIYVVDTLYIFKQIIVLSML